MITHALFVKVLETQAMHGDRATKSSPAWQVTVCNGYKSFIPMKHVGYFSDENYFVRNDAIAWAKEVAQTLGGVPVSLYVLQWPTSPELFVEDLE